MPTDPAESALREMYAGLFDLRDELILKLVGKDSLSTVEVQRMRKLLDAKRGEDIAAEMEAVLGRYARWAYENGTKQIDRALDGEKISDVLQVPPTNIEIAQGYDPSYIKTVAPDLLDELRQQVTLSFLGSRTPAEIAQRITKRFDVSAGRAEVIVRTEGKKLQNFGAQARIDDTFRKANTLGVPMLVYWIHSSGQLLGFRAGKERKAYEPRPHHKAMHGTTRKEAEKFELHNGETGMTYRIDGPHDPLLPVEEVVNCYCDRSVRIDREAMKAGNVVTPQPVPAPAPAPRPNKEPTPKAVPTPRPAKAAKKGKTPTKPAQKTPKPGAGAPKGRTAVGGKAPAKGKNAKPVNSAATDDAQKKAAPVSASIAASIGRAGNGPVARNSRRALDIIDTVHGDGELPKVKFKTVDARSYAGALSVNARTNEPLHIEISKHGGHHEMTMAHEMGHLIDFAGLKNWRQPGGGSKDEASPVFGVMDAIANSRSFKALEDARNTGRATVLRKSPGGGTIAYQAPISRRVTDYMLDKNELFARAYAQFIAVESGDKVMLGQLAKLREFDRATGCKSHWDDDDFEPIHAEMKAAFKKLGWM